MKQPVHPHDPRGIQAPTAAPSASSPSVGFDLSSVQKEVLENLGVSGGALTLRQLEKACGCTYEELAEAVDGLIQASLVSRLNTIIPSYTNRYPGVRVYGE